MFDALIKCCCVGFVAGLIMLILPFIIATVKFFKDDLDEVNKLKTYEVVLIVLGEHICKCSVAVVIIITMIKLVRNL